MGNEIYSKSINEEVMIVDTKSFEPGIYVVKTKIEGVGKSIRFIKE